MRLPTGFLARLGPSFEKVRAVHIMDKDVLPPVAPVHHVVNGARILPSHRARHGPEMTNSPAPSSRMNRLRAGHPPADPFLGVLLVAVVTLSPHFCSAKITECLANVHFETTLQNTLKLL